MKGNINYAFSDDILCHQLEWHLITYRDDFRWDDPGIRFSAQYNDADLINKWEVINGGWIIGERYDGTVGSTAHPSAPAVDVSKFTFFTQKDIETVLGITNFNNFNQNAIKGAADWVDDPQNFSRYSLMLALSSIHVGLVAKYRYLSPAQQVEHIPEELAKKIAQQRRASYSDRILGGRSCHLKLSNQ
jgi:hypothetical protein